jgi:hypothetical protein
MDAGAMALLDDATSGAERSPPALEWSCIPHSRTAARAAAMDTVVVRPTGPVRDGWHRTAPHSRGVQPLCTSETRSAAVPRGAG